MKKETEIYQIDDKVFDARFGWGKIKSIEGDNIEYPIFVIFKMRSYYYTKKGFDCYESLIPTLSFIEYDFVNGGFSQNREDINKHLIGKLGFFWNNGEKLDGSVCIIFGLLVNTENNRFILKGNFSHDNFSIECPIKLS